MSTARQCLKSPQSLSGTSAHPTMVTLVNIMVMNRWLTSFSFHVNRLPHSWDKAISYSDLEISTPRSRSWVWSKGKVIQSAQYHINSLHFHFTPIRPTIPEKELFEIWPWNIQGQGHDWGQRSHIVLSIQLMHFLFVSHQSDQLFLRYGQNSVWPWKNTSKIFKENLQKIKVSNRTSPKSNQVITMARAIKLPCFVVIQWVVLTLSCRQANFC